MTVGSPPSRSSPALRSNAPRLRHPAPVFTSLILDLALKYGDPRGVRGDHLHGWFYDQLKKRDAALWDRLHAGTGHKPLALLVGPRFGLGPRGVTRDTSDDRHWLRISSLDATLTAFIDAVLAEQHTIVLGPAEFTLSRTIRDPCEHPWARSESPDALWERWMEGVLLPKGRVRLRFLDVAPTAFGGDHHSVQLFPIPKLVFGSLIDLWTTYASLTHDDERLVSDLKDGLLGVVREERHEIRTIRPLSFEDHDATGRRVRYQMKGFVGTCEYSVATEQPELKRLLHLLADFAFFSGVGLRRGMGMGQVLGEAV